MLKPTTHKTAQLVSQLGAWGVGTDNVLLVDLEFDADLSLAVRNIPKVDNCTISELSAVDLVGFDRIIVSASALKGLEVMYQ
ncbi:MAG: 50S ribosomal protein L4 [Gammaproteobacteria bacterium]|nr:MAG: 50S ribosomal protein L4 [Gammaproteobacteria bacterium]